MNSNNDFIRITIKCYGKSISIWIGSEIIAEEDNAYILSSLTKDGSLSIVIRLQAEHMVYFENSFYCWMGFYND